jgi:hypothetical protein
MCLLSIELDDRWLHVVVDFFPPPVAERLDVCVLTFLDQLQKFRIKKWGEEKKGTNQIRVHGRPHVD